MAITRKFLVNLEQQDIIKQAYHKTVFEQSYISLEPEILIKKIIEDSEWRNSIKYTTYFLVADGVEIELTKDQYSKLEKVKKIHQINKTRYYLTIRDNDIVDAEIDVYKGVIVAKFDFENEEQANRFKVPKWCDPKWCDSEIYDILQVKELL